MNNFGNEASRVNASREDVLVFRFLKLFHSLKQASEILVEFAVNLVLFASSLLAWLFQFKCYFVIFAKRLTKFVSKVSSLVPFQQKVYILITIAVLYLLLYLGSRLYTLIQVWRRRYHSKWHLLITHLLFILSPYVIFVLAIYFPLCALLPSCYFEAILVRFWILWMPLGKAVVSVHRSLHLNTPCSDSEPKESEISRVIRSMVHRCESYNNTDLILNFLETISSRIGGGGRLRLQGSRNRSSEKPLKLLNSKSLLAREIISLKVLQCWCDYFCLWLIYFFLGNYILGDSIRYISSIMAGYFRVANNRQYLEKLQTGGSPLWLSCESPQGPDPPPKTPVAHNTPYELEIPAGLNPRTEHPAPGQIHPGARQQLLHFTPQLQDQH
ncbi:hypothetical protein HWI79_2336 [Cryptosporidium felis]|nr:hypothetical protein HWI79_2336 [Cryptosporidium felis]